MSQAKRRRRRSINIIVSHISIKEKKIYNFPILLLRVNPTSGRLATISWEFETILYSLIPWIILFFIYFLTKKRWNPNKPRSNGWAATRAKCSPLRKTLLWHKCVCSVYLEVPAAPAGTTCFLLNHFFAPPPLPLFYILFCNSPTFIISI